MRQEPSDQQTSGLMSRRTLIKAIAAVAGTTAVARGVALA
jgi:gluconolactonase